jgi:hypothetical protein
MKAKPTIAYILRNNNETSISYAKICARITEN